MNGKHLIIKSRERKIAELTYNNQQLMKSPTQSEKKLLTKQSCLAGMSSFFGKLSNFHDSLRTELQRQKEGWKEVCVLMQKFNLVNHQSITASVTGADGQWSNKTFI